MCQGRNNTVVLLDSMCGQTTQGTAVLLVDDYIVAYVHQTTREVTGISRFKRGIRHTLTGTVGRDEVLQHGEAFLKVRKNRVFNSLTSANGTGLLRFSHQATHTCELANLLCTTTGSGVHHHEDGVEALVSLFHRLHQGFRNLIGNRGPSINDAVITTIIGNNTGIVRLGDFLYFSITIGNYFVLISRNQDIIQVEAQATLERLAVTEVLDIIQEDCRTTYSTSFDDHRDHLLNSALLHGYVLIADFFGHVSVNHRAARGCLNDFSVNTNLDEGVDVHFTFVQSNGALFRRVEDKPFSFNASLGFGNIVQTQNHILRRYGNRITVSRVKDIV